MRGKYGSFIDAFGEWNDNYVYEGEDNLNGMHQAAQILARDCISMFESPEISFLFDPNIFYLNIYKLMVYSTSVAEAVDRSGWVLFSRPHPRKRTNIIIVMSITSV